MDTSNEVKLIGYYGSDRTIALAAWTSTQGEMTLDKEMRIPSFVKKLAADRHTVPFEHTLLQFGFCTDLATQIQVMKHRIGMSMSSQSFRWKEQELEFYVPPDWAEEQQNELRAFQAECVVKYHNLISSLVESGLSRKRAKETARYVVPYSVKMRYQLSCNIHSFAKFCHLRAGSEAQREISDLTQNCIRLVYNTGAFDAALEGWDVLKYIK